MNEAYYLVIVGMGVTFLLALSLIFFYGRYQGRLQKAALAHQVELLHATIRSQEEERKRIGRDLHDGVGGQLSNIKMTINRMNGSNAAAEQCGVLIDKTITDVRSISHSLCPPALELFGLVAALEELADDMNRSSLQVTIENKSSLQINDTAGLMLYRILQEMLANTLKHAHASAVVIRLSDNGIEYNDNGRGFDMHLANVSGMGMRNIESRAAMIGASCAIYSSPGDGFKATIHLN